MERLPPGVLMTDVRKALSFYLLELILPALCLNALAAWMCRPSFKRLRNGLPLFSVGGKSGPALFFDSVVTPTRKVWNMFVCMATYMFFGALCMIAIEGEHEEHMHAAFQAKMADYKRRVSPAVYTDLVADLGDPDATPWRNWDLAGAFYYCFTLVTTIGYGSFGPATDGGKYFTAVFALCGIPMFLITLSTAGAALPEILFGWLSHWAAQLTRAKLRELFARYLAHEGPPVPIEEVQALYRAGDRHPIAKALGLSHMGDVLVPAPLVDHYFRQMDDGDGKITVYELEKVIELIVALCVGEP